MVFLLYQWLFCWSYQRLWGFFAECKAGSLWKNKFQFSTGGQFPVGHKAPGQRLTVEIQRLDIGVCQRILIAPHFQTVCNAAVVVLRIQTDPCGLEQRGIDLEFFIAHGDLGEAQGRQDIPGGQLSHIFVSAEAKCIEDGYKNSCEDGKILDPGQVCSYNSAYKKCECNPCDGYEYSYAQATEQGYEPDGEACSSCGTKKYKRKAKECLGFSACDCGGEIGSTECWSGQQQMFLSCKKCTVECSSGQIDLDSYWCNGALKCFQCIIKNQQLLYPIYK